MTNRAPDLTGAWIERVESVEGRLTLFVDGVRRLGLVYTGHILFEGVDTREGTSTRPLSTPPVLSGGMKICAQHDEPDTTVLEVERWTGPGDKDEFRFTISHWSVSSALRLRPGKTLRAWAGFYPRARDWQTK